MISRRAHHELDTSSSPRPSLSAARAAARSARSRSPIGPAVLLAALAAGCGGQSTSTDTGNPPVIAGTRLHLAGANEGVIVSGAAGAVASGARVDVVDVSTGQTATTTAKEDGSFQIAIAGAVTHEYRVYAANGDQNSHIGLSASGAGAAQVGLAGLDFLLQSAEGYTPVTGTKIRLAFKDAGISFSAGCNQFGGSYAPCDGKLCVSELGSTDMGCDEARMAQDHWLSTFLQASPRVSQVGPTLTLQGADAKLDFLDRTVADPDRPLTGRTWRIDTFVSAGGAASSIPSKVPPTLQFGTDGSLSVFTTCNTGAGTYTQSGQTLTLANVAYPDAPCGSDGNTTVQNGITSVIQNGDVTFAIDTARLTITRGTVGLAATTD